MTEANIGTLIKNRRKLSEIIKNSDKERKETIQVHKNRLEKIDIAILRHLNEQKIDSVKSEFGTAFKDTKDSVTISDSLKFKKHIICEMLMGLQSWRYVNNDGDWQPAVGERSGGEDILADDCIGVLDSSAFDLLTLQANKNACKQFMRENDGQLPAGISYTSFVDLKVRK